MSLGEMLYLAMIGFMFVSFIVLFATLSWLDLKDERIKRLRDRRDALATRRTPAAPRGTGSPKTAFHGG